MNTTIDSPEVERLAALYDLAILDTTIEREFQAIASIARIALQAPIVLVSLVGRDRLQFKARIGLDLSETPRSTSFCTYALAQSDIFIVPDASRDERFVDNPLVTGPPYGRFYAGAPFKTDRNISVGTLCVIDTKPRPDLLEDEVEALERLAAEAVALMKRRRLGSRLRPSKSTGLRQHHHMADILTQSHS